jgi:glycyl-tRNA synthetase alpha subunit
VKNPYLTQEEVVKTFLEKIAVQLEESHSFLPEDLETIATGFIMEAMPAIARTERQMCIKVVRSLNSVVADKLEEVRGPL